VVRSKKGSRQKAEGKLERKSEGKSVRGSRKGRPIMVLLDLLGQRWTLRITWELREGRRSFRDLRARCDEVSPTVLNSRLKSLREAGIVDLEATGYGLTASGRELGEQLLELDRWAKRWAKSIGSRSARSSVNS
jgi:DNA-binding HxlR family transcriptional regulator